MIKAHALGADAAGAERWFDEMKMLGVAHDRKSYSALATAYANTRPVPFDRVEVMVKTLQSRKKVRQITPVPIGIDCVIYCAFASLAPRPRLFDVTRHSCIGFEVLCKHGSPTSGCCDSMVSGVHSGHAFEREY